MTIQDTTPIPVMMPTLRRIFDGLRLLNPAPATNRSGYKARVAEAQADLETAGAEVLSPNRSKLLNRALRDFSGI